MSVFQPNKHKSSFCCRNQTSARRKKKRKFVHLCFFASSRCRRMKQPAVELIVTVWLNAQYGTHTVYIYTYIWSPSPSHTGVVFVVSCFSLQFACSSLFSHLLLPSCEDLWWRWILTNTVWWGTAAYFSFCARFDLKDEVSPVMKGLVMTQTCAGFVANDLENIQNKTYKTHFDLLRLFLWDLRVLKGWRAPTSIQCAFKRSLWIIIKP